jgi:hypothetical protein
MKKDMGYEKKRKKETCSKNDEKREKERIVHVRT